MRPDVIQMLAAKGHPVGDALMVAAAYGDTSAIDALADAGADVNQATRNRSRDQIRCPGRASGTARVCHTPTTSMARKRR